VVFDGRAASASERRRDPVREGRAVTELGCGLLLAAGVSTTARLAARLLDHRQHLNHRDTTEKVSRGEAA